MVKFNEHLMHFVNLSFVDLLVLSAIPGLNLIGCGWYYAIILH